MASKVLITAGNKEAIINSRLAISKWSITLYDPRYTPQAEVEALSKLINLPFHPTQVI